jgi:hypothetical protein
MAKALRQLLSLQSDEDGYEVISQSATLIQACPYHSKKDPNVVIPCLPSFHVAREFVHTELLPLARRGEILLFVWRKAREWDLTLNGGTIIGRDPSRAWGRYLYRESEQEPTLQFILKGSRCSGAC